MEINILERKDAAVAYFLEGYNCAQSVLMAYSDICNIDITIAKKIAAPFGAGMGRMKEVCGACTAMYMISGFCVSNVKNPNDEIAKTNNYLSVQRMSNEFKKTYGSIICSKLLKIKNFSKDKISTKHNFHLISERTCVYFVVEAAEIVGHELLSQ